MTEKSNIALVHAYELDGKGSGREVTLQECLTSTKPLWLHLGDIDQNTKDFLVHQMNISRDIVKRLMVEDTRPYTKIFDDFALVFVRGVNLNPDEKPDDMIMLRVLIKDNLIITVRRRSLKAIKDVKFDFANNQGPHNTTQMLASIIEHLIDRMWPVHDQINDVLSANEDYIFSNQKKSDIRPLKERENLSSVRLQILQLHRYIRPMHDALVGVEKLADFKWAKQSYLNSIDESEERLLQLIADLEHFKSRADILNEEIARLNDERQGRATYFLTVVATLFLPPSLITGIFGMNNLIIPFTNIELGLLPAMILVFISVALPLALLKRADLLPKS